MESTDTTVQPRWFATTRWSLVLRAGDDSPEARQALEQLCLLYWYPLFTFARCIGHTREEAEDLTQGFFAQLLARRSLQTISRVGGRFRSFLLVAFKHFVANQSARNRTRKRGGDAPHLALDVPACGELIDAALNDRLTPDRLFDRAWGLVVLGRAQAALRTEYDNAGRRPVFEKLMQFLPGETANESQIDAARATGMTEGAFRMELHRFKQRLARAIRDEVAETIGPNGVVDQEVRSLLAAFRNSV
ncbi:MAG TPA: sigma-70 family RNA polymerase sigma factor [Verrucomicrobiae bacterium]|nr:sigma-70 family RNA polymerase sigma factor [Verrucomicrobiae bacterium]